MMNPSSFATLIIVSRLSCNSSAVVETFTCADGIDDDNVDTVFYSKDVANNMLRCASFALAVTLSMAHAISPAALTQALSTFERCEIFPENVSDEPRSRNRTGDIDEPSYNNVKVLKTHRTRSIGGRKYKKTLQTSECYDEVPEMGAFDTPPLEACVTTPKEEPVIFTTRRQRRANDTTSDNYSDFCDNDLSRQIEAMVLRVETEYANRRVKKTKQNTATHSVSKRMISKEAAQEVRADTSTKIEDGLVKVPSMHVVHDKESDDVRRNPTNNLLKLINLAQGNTSKSISRKIFNAANANPHQLLRHTLKSMKASDDVPAMKPCDSMASFSSDYSFASMSRSSSNFLNFARSKKSNGAMPGSNAEWAIIE